MQYLYPEGDSRVFMDTQSYEQISLSNEQLGENAQYLLDGTQVDIMLFDGRPIGVTPPTFVELVVTETEPGFKGDTSSNTTKPATLETGLQINVPLFVNAGDKLKVDTRTGAYVERVKG
jgi:elongation factor P